MLQKYQDVDREAKGGERVAMTIVRKEKKHESWIVKVDRVFGRDRPGFTSNRDTVGRK